MSTYHLVRGGEIVESRDFAEGETIPDLAGNKGEWLPELVVDYEPFDPISQVRTGPVRTISAIAVVLDYTVRDKSEDEIEAMRAAKAVEYDAEAGARILTLMSEVQQRNSLALGMEMVTTHGPDPTQWPAPEQAIYADVMARWVAIKAVRTRVAALKAAIPDVPTEIVALDASEGWD